MTLLGAREAYSCLAEEYDASPNALIALEQRTMAPLIPENLEGLTVIDVASGTGRWARLCRDRGARTIAIDFCHEMRPSVQADARRLPLPDASSDITICAFALGYAPECFAELVRITKPGGMLLVSDVHPEALKRGWTRSFRHRGEVIQVVDQPYALADLRAPSLQLSCMLEPSLGLPERHVFEQAGHLDRFAEACREPAIFVALWGRLSTCGRLPIGPSRRVFQLTEIADPDLTGLQILPGLINAHDHLQFSLFPRLGSGPYANATEWARDIYHPDRDPIRHHLQVPKHLRLIWGGLRNLAGGVTTVSHHDAYHPIFDENFPVRVIKQYGWAHSLEFTQDVRACFDATPPGAPFIIHLGEGTDATAAEEIFRLHELGALDSRTVLVHAAALSRKGWDLVGATGASVIWCPRSNLFTLGQTLSANTVPSGIPMALGTDSSLTTEGDLLDELEHLGQVSDRASLVSTIASRILRLPPRPDDWIAATHFGAPPELVVIRGVIHLISARLAEALPPNLRPEFYPFNIETRPPVLVRWNVPQLLIDTSRYLDSDDIRLAGRKVSA